MAISIQIISSQGYSFTDNDFQMLEQTDDISLAVELCEKTSPNIILLDYSLQMGQSNLLVKSLCCCSKESKIILLGDSLSDEQVLECLFVGIYGYLDINDFDRFLIKAIKVVNQGEAWVTRRLVGKLIESIRE